MKYLLEELVDLKIGRTPPRKEQWWFSNTSGVKWVSIKDMGDSGRFIDNTSEFLVKDSIDKFNIPIVKKGTVILSFKLTVGRVSITQDDMLTNEAIAQLPVKDEKILNPMFLYYYLKSYNFNQLGSTSSIAQAINSKYLKKMEIDIPEISMQNKIVDILSSIDSYIECNQKINNNLEQQAQMIFKEWFINNPEKNKWSTGTFSELIKATLNGDWGKEAPTDNNSEKVYCIRGADIPEVKAGNKGKMPTRYIPPKNFDTKKLTAGDIVVEISGGSPTQSTGRCTAITQSLLDRYDSGMVCTNFCKAIKPKEGYSLFIYYYWQYLYGKGVFFSYENGTTGIKNLDFSGFIETETILIPPKDRVVAFDDYCNSIFNHVFSNGKKNEHLALLRDTLLPKLMSGELDVSDIDL